jgi:hypothetical protein
MNTKTLNRNVESVTENLSNDIKDFVVAKQNMGSVEKWDAFAVLCSRYKNVFSEEYILQECNKTIRKMGFSWKDRE